MSLHDDLLAQARELATAPDGPLLDVNLRRAISSAYYALFHLLISEAVTLLIAEGANQLADKVSRAFTHTEMYRVCGSFVRRVADDMYTLLPYGVSTGLRSVAATFIELQKARHAADYDRTFSIVRSFTLSRVEEAENAFKLWNEIKRTDEAKVFLTALAFAGRWSR